MMMTSSAPVIVGGGIVCALGAHLPSVMASMTAGAARLAAEVRYGEQSIRLGVVRGLLREARGVGLTMAMLADAVDYALGSFGDAQLGRYAAVFAVPEAPCGPFATADSDAAVTATGVRAGMHALLAERLHPPETAQVFVGRRASGQCIEVAAKLLRERADLDGCLVAASDAHTRVFTAEPTTQIADLPHRYAAGDAAAALWLLRPRHAEEAPRLLSAHAGLHTDPDEALRLAIFGSLNDADVTLSDVRHLVHDSPWGDRGRKRRAYGLHATEADTLCSDYWSPAQSIGDVGVAQGVIQTLHAASLTQRGGGGQSALVVLSDGATTPTAWVVSAPAVASPHHEGRVPCAL